MHCNISLVFVGIVPPRNMPNIQIKEEMRHEKYQKVIDRPSDEILKKRTQNKRYNFIDLKEKA